MRSRNVIIRPELLNHSLLGGNSERCVKGAFPKIQLKALQERRQPDGVIAPVRVGLNDLPLIGAVGIVRAAIGANWSIPLAKLYTTLTTLPLFQSEPGGRPAAETGSVVICTLLPSGTLITAPAADTVSTLALSTVRRMQPSGP